MSAIKEHIATKLVPQLRFKEFDGEWNNDKVGSLGNFKGGGTPSTDASEYWEGDIPWISSSDVNEGDVTNLNITRYLTNKAIAESATKKIPKDSVLFVSRVGVGKLAVSKEELCTSQDFANLIPENDSSYFVAYYFIARNKLLHQYSQGTSIKGFTTGDLKSIPINIPSLPEQQKIASFLSAVDEKIQQLTKKKELLEQYKKGVMQQLFSGQLRFKDENGNPYPDWEEKRLGGLGSFKGGGTPTTEVTDYWAGTIPWISSSDLSEEDVTNIKVSRFINDKAISDSATKLIPGGSVLFVSRVGVGKLAVSKGELCTSQDFANFTPSEVNPTYIAYYFLANNNTLHRYAQGTSIKGFTSGDLKSIKIQYPVIEEQQKIARYLSSIDTKIESVNNQITQTQTFKKGLLQQMFV